MQNDDVPKKRTQARFPPGPPQRKAIQGASQGASKRRSKAQPMPVEGTVKGTLQGGLYSRHRLQRREPDNVRESSEPDNVRNLLSRYAK